MQQVLMPARRNVAGVQRWVQQAGGVVAAAPHKSAAAQAHTQVPADDGEAQEHALPAQGRRGVHSHCKRREEVVLVMVVGGGWWVVVVVVMVWGQQQHILLRSAGEAVMRR